MLRIYNTLTKQKEEFHAGSTVKMYVCGVTPYDACHIGHAMSYIVFDVIRRYLEFRGYKVKHIQNFTDIDDKIIARARELGISPFELAARYIDQYFEDMDALNVKRADYYPKVTQEIPEIIEVIKGLLAKGHAYERDGNVYFRVRSFPEYGKLSGRDPSQLLAGARIEIDPLKEDPLDFALWKRAKPGEPFWESPWGKGRPGWHIECSAMALKYLGETLDIHGGGRDLIFPHHENEIAQSEAFTGVKPFARFWIHNELVQLGQVKMSKSTGKLVTIREALSKFSPEAIRLFLLSSHYQTPIAYSEEGIRAAERAVERLRLSILEGPGSEGGAELDPSPFRERFIAAMDDNFNTPKAIAALFDLSHEINRARRGGANVRRAVQTLIELSGVLGIKLEEERKISGDIIPFIELLVWVRSKLRAERNWALADEIRSRLREMGVILEDTPEGTRWRLKRGS